jgi:hypothetical protein
MRLAACAVLAMTSATLAACADTGAISVGKDMYSISVRVPFSGPSGAKGQALQEANAFCAKQNRLVLLDHENSYECALHGGAVRPKLPSYVSQRTIPDTTRRTSFARTMAF